MVLRPQNNLRPATAGSAGVDLATAQSVTLDTTAVVLIPIGVMGPIGNGRSTLLLGRSSTTQMGLFVLPGVIDADFTGEIKIMAWTPSPSWFVPKGQRIAQSVPFL
ncbi:deoxyuridine 5'-triphosphate nucleotidohydrolase-like [Numenius arquata]|uniref:deoxyuridine 5'-triphosphate nucleotidohydrolase-like n=1 Tax=Numenius arquata TaxID=31919 RepID=UPI003D30C924